MRLRRSTRQIEWPSGVLGPNHEISISLVPEPAVREDERLVRFEFDLHQEPPKLLTSANHR